MNEISNIKFNYWDLILRIEEGSPIAIEEGANRLISHILKMGWSVTVSSNTDQSECFDQVGHLHEKFIQVISVYKQTRDPNLKLAMIDTVDQIRARTDVLCNLPEQLRKRKELFEVSYSPRKAARLESPVPRTGRAFRTIWNGLGSHKWREAIDGEAHLGGADCFDEGRMGRVKEPGFIHSWHKGADFLATKWDQKLSIPLYLQLHSILCAHFDGKNNNTEIPAQETGMFRGENQAARQKMKNPLTQETIEMMQQLDQNSPLNWCLYELNQDEQGNVMTISWYSLKPEEIGQVVQHCFNQFYEEIEKAIGKRGKLVAIARLIQHLESIHPTWDGSTRTNIEIMDFLLTQHGFHPTILLDHNAALHSGLDGWIQTIEEGLSRWEEWREIVAYPSLDI